MSLLLGKGHFVCPAKTWLNNACLFKRAAWSDSFHETLSHSSCYFIYFIYATQSLWDSENHGQRFARTAVLQTLSALMFLLTVILNSSSAILCFAVVIV